MEKMINKLRSSISSFTGKITLLALIVILLLAINLAGNLMVVKSTANANITGDADNKLKIVATTMMVGDTVRQIAGDEANVKVLMGPGIDPHTYTPVRSDIIAMGQADLVFVNGLHLEAQLTDLLNQLKSHVPVIMIGDAIDKTKLHNVDSTQYDPHIWMDVNLWHKTIPTITKALCQTREKACSLFTARADSHAKTLNTLNEYIKKAAQSVPLERRIILTAHDAFGYFGASYKFRVEGIQGVSTASEAGVKRITELVDLIVSKKIPVVFVETSVSQRNILSLIEGVKSHGHTIRIGGSLYSDAMGGSGSNADSYVKMIEHNVNTIVSSLGGKLPYGGFANFKNYFIAGLIKPQHNN